MEKTTIEVSEKTWKELNAMKDPGESFDDVIGRILEDIKNED